MRRFVVVSHSRSGSNLLVRSLNAHPEIACFGELLKPDQRLAELERLDVSDEELEELRDLYATDTAGFTDRFFDAADRAGNAAAGFKLFYYHAREAGRGSIWSAMPGRQDWYFIHLHREDVFGAYLSRELAMATSDWLQVPGKSEDPDYRATVTIDVDAFARFRRTHETNYEAARDLLPAERTLTITYEEFTRDFGAGLSSVQEFLGVAPRHQQPPLEKQARRPWREYVTNVAEVERALSTW